MKIGIFTAELMTPGGSSRAGCLLAERLSRRHDVWLISRDVADRNSLERHFGAPLANVRFHAFGRQLAGDASSLQTLWHLLPVHWQSVLEQIPSYRSIVQLKLDLFILNSSSYYMRCPAPKGLFLCMFPWPTPSFPRAAWCSWPVIKPLVECVLAKTLRRDPRAVDSYDVIAANSEFTAHWIKQYWNRNAQVVYSATELVAESPSVEKKRIILAVGRYNWDKQQTVLIQAFRAMRDAHEAGWELHFAGAVHQESIPYHEQLLQLAAGLPVRFHYDLSLDSLRRMYAESAIYWQAKGYMVPHDEPHRMEHFGNTPIEAMSAGCVPVVFDGGGSRETIRHGHNGFRWQTVDELHHFTRRLMFDEQLLDAMRTQARNIDVRFGVAPFLQAIEQIVDDMLRA